MQLSLTWDTCKWRPDKALQATAAALTVFGFALVSVTEVASVITLASGCANIGSFGMRARFTAAAITAAILGVFATIAGMSIWGLMIMCWPMGFRDGLAWGPVHWLMLAAPPLCVTPLALGVGLVAVRLASSSRAVVVAECMTVLAYMLVGALLVFTNTLAGLF